MTNKELIAKSFDIKYYKEQLVVFLVALLIMVLPFSLLFAFLGVVDGAIGYAIITTVILAPFVLYYVYKIRNIYKDPDTYVLYDAVAVEVQATLMRRMYLVLALDLNGKKLRLETNGIFNTSVLSNLYFGDYAQQKFKILYDENNERLVVVNKIDK